MLDHLLTDIGWFFPPAKSWGEVFFIADATWVSRLWTDWSQWLFPVSGAVIFALLVVFGCLGRTVFDRSRIRHSALQGSDIVVGLGIWLIGGEIAGMIVGQWAGAGQVAGEPQELDAGRTALRSLLGQGLGQLPVVLYMLWRTGWTPKAIKELGVAQRPLLKNLIAGIVGVAVTVPLVMGLTSIVAMIGRAMGLPAPTLGHPVLRAVHESQSLGATLLLFLSAMIIAPVLEEFIFRGFVQTAILGSLGWTRRWTAVLLAAMGFALIHVSAPWQVLPGLFVLGVALGWLYERTGSLLPVVIVHVGFNAFNLLMVLVFNPS